MLRRALLPVMSLLAAAAPRAVQVTKGFGRRDRMEPMGGTVSAQHILATHMLV